MKIRTFLLIMIFLLISISSYAQENQIRVNLNVSSMQELRVLEGVNISFEYPWKGMEDGQALIFENVGKVNVRSNVSWSLNVNSYESNRDLEIYIREANSDFAKWQRLNSAVITGQSGQNNISWDIKIVQSRNSLALSSRNSSTTSRSDRNYDMRNLNLMYTLSETY
ncbi:hypothetical protein [Natronospora cellulosivora (SeqCode)]